MEAVDARQEAVRLRLRGLPPEQVAEKLGLPVEEIQRFLREYLTTNYTDLGEVELRLIQLARLESLVNMLWDAVASGDALTEGKQTANFLKAIEAINELMGLHRDPLKEAQVQLTKAQTELVHLVMTELRGQLLAQVQEAVRAIADREELSEAVREQLSIQVDSGWSKWFASAYDVSIKSIQQIEEGRDG